MLDTEIEIWNATSRSLDMTFPSFDSRPEHAEGIQWTPVGIIGFTNTKDVGLYDPQSGQIIDIVNQERSALFWDNPRQRFLYIPTPTDFSIGLESLPLKLVPKADAGSDQIITDTDDSSSESAMLDGSGSSDPDGTIVSYSWLENGMEIAAGINPTVELALGTHVITLVVADDDGLTASDNVVIVVNAPFISSDPVVLYTFDEGSGSTVTDTSGVGSALDLTIADPANVTWGSGTLTIDSATIIDSGVAATKITNAVIASGEITVEAWVTSANTTQDGPARIVTISQDAYYI